MSPAAEAAKEEPTRALKLAVSRGECERYGLIPHISNPSVCVLTIPLSSVSGVNDLRHLCCARTSLVVHDRSVNFGSSVSEEDRVIISRESKRLQI